MPDYSSSTAAASTHGAKKEDRDSVVQLLEAEVVINLLRIEKRPVGMRNHSGAYTEAHLL